MVVAIHRVAGLTQLELAKGKYNLVNMAKHHNKAKFAEQICEQVGLTPEWEFLSSDDWYQSFASRKRKPQDDSSPSNAKRARIDDCNK